MASAGKCGRSDLSGVSMPQILMNQSTAAVGMARITSENGDAASHATTASPHRIIATPNEPAVTNNSRTASVSTVIIAR